MKKFPLKLICFTDIHFSLWADAEMFGGFPGDKESSYQCRNHRRHGFSSWVGKIPWSRKWQYTLVFLPGKYHEQRSLLGYIVHRVAKSQTQLSNWIHTISHYVYVPHLYPFSVDGHVGCFHVLDIVNNAEMNIGVHVSFGIMFFSGQIDGKTVETVADFIFGGSKIAADGVCSHEIKRCLVLGRKVMTNLTY